MRRTARASLLDVSFVRILFVSTAAWLTVVANPSAHAFPELIRHGYVNCIICHVSPSGGGTINDYGRTFSGEGLSSWTTKGEESFLHGLVKRKQIPKWLSIGGDVRAAQVYQNTPSVTIAKTIMMQADFEAAARIGGLTLDAGAGRIQTNPNLPPKLGTHRFFAMYNFTDELMVRAGRFTPVYGINLPDHIIDTRGVLQFDQGGETYNLEGSWITDTWNVVLTGYQGPADTDYPLQENGGIAQVSYAFHDTYKIGASSLYGRTNTQTRQLNGAHALFGFTEKFYYMGEADWQGTNQISTNVNTVGFFDYNRLGYEVFRGAHLLTSLEYWETDILNSTTANDRYGIGTQLFPRPHFDIQAMWTKWRTRSAGDNFIDYAWTVLHYYF